MKHLYIIDEHQSSKQNGIGTYINQLLKCLENTGNDVNLLSFNSDQKDFIIEQLSLYTVYHIPICGMSDFLNNGKLILSLLRLYINDSKENVFILNHFPCDKFLVDIKQLFPLSRTIYVIHDQGWCAPLYGDVNMFRKVLNATYYPKNDKQVWRSIRNITLRERRMYKLVDDIIALSSSTYNLLVDLYKVPADKIHLIPNGLQKPVEIKNTDPASIRKRLGIAQDEIVLLFTGRTSTSKGIVPMLKAFEKLWIEHPKLHLIIAGEVLRFNDFVKLTPHSISHITYTGLLSQEQLAYWYIIADIGILPSYTEQSSYTGIEMLAYGKLIVTTDGHNLKDMFNDEIAIVAHINRKGSGKSTDVVSSLMEAINKALHMEADKRHYLQQQAIKHFNIVYSFPKWKSIYTQLING